MRRKYVYTIATLALVIGLFGISFGYLKDVKQSSSNTTINLSNFGIQFQNGKNVNQVTFPDNTYPMSDAEGLNNPAITFGIENIESGIKANYKVSLVDGQTKSTMLNKDAKYQLKKGVNGATPTVVGIFNLRDDGVIDEGTISPGDTIDYELVMWIDYDANPNGLTFNKYVLVEGMQIASLDSSGANFPELAENMIPVYYVATSDTEGVWKKADPTNGLDPLTNQPITTPNYQYQWFDYDNQMWANAVTVKENGTQTREYYLNAELGTTIPMEDITTMWVWIPRYKYVIFNNNNETVEKQMIDVTFEHGRETTGTAMCHDDIQTENKSEICVDTSNAQDKIVNKKSTYTHPAFCFGTKNNDGTCNGEELTGFWMGKFEMSTDDNDCNTTANETNCNKTGLNILIKPNQYALRYESVSTMFANIRRMESFGNIHGFKQNENATTWLNSSSNLTGEINNDSNTIDTHMIKNMEWGAVAYLSQSKYGKQGNSSYTGDYKEIYINNNSDLKTGYSGGSYNSVASTSSTYLYNNLTTNGEGQGYKGSGSSTSGTVYGIFDMSGGTEEITMTNKGTIDVQSSGFSQNQYPIGKYYNMHKTPNISKLGDAFGETSGWYNDLLSNSVQSFITRGHDANGGVEAGIFAKTSKNGSAVTYISSRPVLTISRNMPWLNSN